MTHRGPFQALPFCDAVILSLGQQRARNPQCCSRFQASNILQQPWERNHSCRQPLHSTESPAPGTAGPRRRPPRRSRNVWPRQAEPPAPQRPRNLHEPPRSWAKWRAILAGVVATVEKNQKAITALTLITKESHPPISLGIFNS